MEEPFTWEGRQVAIGQAVYHSIEPCAHHTLFWAYAQYGPEKVALLAPIERTCIWRARNMLLDEFFRKDYKRLIMVDSDMAFPCGSPSTMKRYGGGGLPASVLNQNFISRMMSYPEDKGVVGALYFGRHENGRALCASAFESDAADAEIRRSIGGGLRQEKWVATGCLMIQRWVVEKLKQAAPEKWPDITPKNGGEWGFFNPLSAVAGEDVSFGVRCNQIGIQSFLDLSLVCLHKGDAYFGPNNTTLK